MRTRNNGEKKNKETKTDKDQGLILTEDLFLFDDTFNTFFFPFSPRFGARRSNVVSKSHERFIDHTGSKTFCVNSPLRTLSVLLLKAFLL